MEHARFDRLTHEIATDATAEQLVDLESRIRALLAGKVTDALLARRSINVDNSRTCPRCGHKKVVRHGRDAGGRQRFRCLPLNGKGCGRTFNALTDTAFARMRKPELWLGYARLLSEGHSLDKLMEHDPGISRLTAWRWRHRLLTAITPKKPDRLGGVVEVDETYFLRSFKGHRGWKRGCPPEPRRPRYRGSGALLPGLSWQQVPVLTAVDRDRRHVDAVMNKRSAVEAAAILRGTIIPGSVLCSDAWKAYGGIAREHDCEHRIIKPPKNDWVKKAKGHAPRNPGRLGLGRVNAHHERMETLVNRIHRGVSTRYLRNYITLLWSHAEPRASRPENILKRALEAD